MNCSVKSCTRTADVGRRGWCLAHYKRWYRYGHPELGCRPRGLTDAETFSWFMPGDPPESGCWDWSASTNSGGYGQARIGKRIIKAHVLSYQVHHGPIVNGLYVLHSCDRPICVQPAHLRLGTAADNVHDAVIRGRHRNGRNGAKV